MNLSPGRRAWLESLLHGPKRRPRGNVGYDCMQADWTEWDYRTREGWPISEEDARIRFGERWWEHVAHPHADRITEAGRAALAEYKKAGDP